MIYLDNAATTYPKPYSVYKAMEYAATFAGGNPGRTSGKMSLEAMKLIYTCRERLAALFHIRDPSRIVFTQNATHALNLGLFGLLSPGDTLLTSVLEHNSVLRPAEALRKIGVYVRLLPADIKGGISPEALRSYLSPPPKLVVLTHASNVTGIINDMEAIGALVHGVGSLFMVDAAQTAGCVPIDVEKMHIDLLAFPGHKGLLGPTGTGGLYVREGIDIKPLILGGTGTNSKDLSQPEDFPERLESGTLNTIGLAGLSAGVAYIEKHGVATIYQKEHDIAGMLLRQLCHIEGVTPVGSGDNRAGVVCVRLSKADYILTAECLSKDFGIITRGGFHCAPLAHKAMGTETTGALRFSVGPFTTMKDVTTAAAALKIIISKKASLP
ncbi:MAG: aminotransferase class V-fold PLP-dependent enzyme [Clostridia bacterium]|nr:aminotransferase class V-fold PLP-dependent enzyme [Clostridia bacterium]